MQNKSEEEILSLLKDGLTIRKIASRRKISIRAVQKTVKKLKEKGLILGNSCSGFVLPIHHTPIPPPLYKHLYKLIRLHGQEFHLKIKFKPANYQPHTTTEIKGNKIRFFNDSVEVYIKQSFFGKTGSEAHHNSKLYFQRFLMVLQDKTGLLFNQIKEVNSHYAEIDNELAKDNHSKKDKLEIRAKEDNKVWAKTDFSFNINEFEFLHPTTSLKDTDNIISYFNDLRNNSPPVASEQYKLICGIANNQQMFNENLIKHMKVLDDMSLTMKHIRNSLKHIPKAKSIYLRK
jgi:DNA-binding transcriptional ArsR family regulator